MIDTNAIQELRELVNNNAVLKQSEILELLDSHDELERKLEIAENGLKEVIDWANWGNKVDCEKEKALFRIFLVAKTLIKQIRGE